MSVFFKKILRQLPFYYRFYKKEELIFSNNDKNTSIDIITYENDLYHTKIYSNSLPLKPISKMLSYEDQKNF